ncbi:universal stress protein [Paenibacillus ginsengihumi]|uniref:universal stress protein n=1 Tax=Paenibacillus ginsengihumi TaxID=431596 RepID=UPI00037C28E3|nr:universal stress protein [Paenibacillus ginsengihumi]
MIFNKILIAYDGSEASERALDKAVKLVKEGAGGGLEIVHSSHVPVMVVGDAIFNVSPDVERQQNEYSDKVVERARQAAEGLPNVRVVRKQGNAARAILEHAEETGCDLIVMGSRGLGGLSELFLGSVSHHVVHHATIPVMIVK